MLSFLFSSVLNSIHFFRLKFNNVAVNTGPICVPENCPGNSFNKNKASPADTFVFGMSL